MSATPLFEMAVERLEVRSESHNTRLRLLELREIASVGPPGPRGPRGFKGDKPAHEWHDTELRFENPDGSWGEFVNLKGPRGERGYAGGSGGPGPQGIPGTGGGTGNGLLVPRIIAADETFTIPANAQVPWMLTIDIAGTLDIEGDFVQVN